MGTLNEELKQALSNLSQQLDVLILRNTLKKKRVTDADHKANLQQTEAQNTEKLLENQASEIKGLQDRIKQLDDIDYQQELAHRCQDYEAEILKLKKMNKLKEVSNMREGRQVMKDYEFRKNSKHYLATKQLYFDSVERKRQLQKHIQNFEDKITAMNQRLDKEQYKFDEA